MKHCARFLWPKRMGKVGLVKLFANVRMHSRLALMYSRHNMVWGMGNTVCQNSRKSTTSQSKSKIAISFFFFLFTVAAFHFPVWCYFYVI